MEGHKRSLIDLVNERNRILRTDITRERQFSGSLDSSILTMNALTFIDWPLFLSDDGDPQSDPRSGTYPYLSGIILTDAIPIIREWCNHNGYRFIIDDTGLTSDEVYDDSSDTVVIYTGALPCEKGPRGDLYDPSKVWWGIGICNWIDHNFMMMGESDLILSAEQKETLINVIYGGHYTLIGFNGTRSKTNLWPQISGLLQFIAD